MVQKIKEFDPGVAAAVTSAIRNTASFERTCDQLEALYQKTMSQGSARPKLSPNEESQALSLYLSGLGQFIKGADDRFASLRRQRDKSKDQNYRSKQRLAELKIKMDLIEKRVPKFIRRWLLRDG